MLQKVPSIEEKIQKITAYFDAVTLLLDLPGGVAFF